MSVSFDVQIFPVAVRGQIGFGRAAPLSILLHHLHPAKPFHARAVLVGARRVTRLYARLDEGFAKRIG
ncbi:hypothetical protein D3C73_1637740 [compost metagenome]